MSMHSFIIVQGILEKAKADYLMSRIDKKTVYKWSERFVVAVFFIGLAMRLILGEVDDHLRDSYVLWWDPVGFACIIGMGVFGALRRIKYKRGKLEAANGEQCT